VLVHSITRQQVLTVLDFANDQTATVYEKRWDALDDGALLAIAWNGQGSEPKN